MCRNTLCSLFALLLFSKAFPQGGTDRCLQLDLGNNYFVRPISPIDRFSPSVQLNIISGRYKENAVSIYFLGGLAYNYSTQSLNVLWSGSTGISKDQFQTHEILFNAGCHVKYTVAKFSICAVSIFQGGPDFTWTNDPHTKITSYNSFRKSKYFKWECMQLYFAPGLQLQYAIDEDLSLQCGIMPRIFLYREYLREDYLDPVKFNYAPIKVNVSVGLQFRMMR